jgi:tetratricopeptide (TPR) repeat protein
MVRRLIVAIILVLVLVAVAQAKDYTGFKAEVETLLVQGKFPAALEKLKAAEIAGNIDADFYFLRGKARTGMGQFKQAMADIDKCLEMEPDFVEAIGHKAIIQLNGGDPKSSLETVNRAMAIRKDADIYYTRGAVYSALRKYDLAVEDLNNALVLDSKRPDFLVARGEIEIRLKRFDPAKSDFEKAIELSPNDPRPYLGRGGLYLMTGEHVKARADFDRCIEIDPNFAIAYLRRGKYYEISGDLRRALNDFTKAAEGMPGSDEAWFERAMTELKMGLFEESEKSARHLLRVTNHPNRGHKLLGTVLASRGKTIEAIKELSLAIDINPKDVESMYLRGSTYATMQKYDQAIADYDKAISILPQYLEPYLSKADVYMIKKEPEKALAIYDMLLTEDPKNTLALRLRSKLHEAMGNYDASLADLRRLRAVKAEAAQ